MEDLGAVAATGCGDGGMMGGEGRGHGWIYIRCGHAGGGWLPLHHHPATDSAHEREAMRRANDIAVEGRVRRMGRRRVRRRERVSRPWRLALGRLPASCLPWAAPDATCAGDSEIVPVRSRELQGIVPALSAAPPGTSVSRYGVLIGGTATRRRR